MKLFNRRVRLVVAQHQASSGLDVSDLDIAFDIRKTLLPKPNVAKITIRNMTEDHRAVFETAEALLVELHAGYEDGMSLLYLGEMRAAVTSRTGPDIITTLTSGDKAGVFAGKTIRVAVGAGTTGEDAIRLLGQALESAGVGKGNLEAAFKAQSAAKGVIRKGVIFPVGGVLSGNVARQMTSICNGAGFEWTIDDGLLVLLEKGKALEDVATLLGPDTGLVGTLSVSNKGYVKATALLQPSLRCGHKVVFDAETNLKGAYRIDKVRYEGDTFGKAWYAHIEGANILP